MTPIRRIFLTTGVLAASAGCAGTSRAPDTALGTSMVSASPRPARPDVAVTAADASAAEACQDGCCEGGPPEAPPIDDFVGGAAATTESAEAPAGTGPPRSPVPFET